MAQKKTGEMPKGRGKRPAKRETTKKEHRWTDKEKVFVDAYCRCFNGAEAARKAGYSMASIYEIAHQNLRKLHIRAEIQRRLDEVHMTSVEVLARLADQARGSMRPFVNTENDGSIFFDFSGPDAKEHLHFIKAINTKRTRRVQGKGDDAEQWEDEYVRVELQDTIHALELIGKAHKLFVERQEHSGPDGGPIQVFDMNSWKRERAGRLKSVATLQE